VAPRFARPAPPAFAALGQAAFARPTHRHAPRSTYRCGPAPPAGQRKIDPWEQDAPDQDDVRSTAFQAAPATIPLPGCWAGLAPQVAYYLPTSDRVTQVTLQTIIILKLKKSYFGIMYFSVTCVTNP
jgi:hypothetical protein